MEPPSNLRFRLFIMTLSVAFSAMVAISIQVPAFSTLDVARTSFKNTSNSFGVNEIRYGVWSACLQRSTNSVNACDGFSPCVPSNEMRICSPKQYGYRSQVGPTNATSETFVLKPTWTRALPLLAANAIMTAIVLVLLIFHWPSTCVSLCAIFVGCLALFTEFAFYYHIKYGMKKFNGSIGVQANIGPGFALSLISFVLLVLEAILGASEDEETTKRRTTQRPSGLLPLHSISGQYRTPQAPLTVPRAPEPALTVTRLSRTPSIRSVRVEDDYECPICWEGGELESGETPSSIEYSSLPCKHIFCTSCITTALGNAGRCPLCNAQCTVSDLRPAPRKEKEKNRFSWFPLSKAQDSIKSPES